MLSKITATTEINMIVNGVHTFTIKNNPETGLSWIIRSDMNREYYIQGLYALAEASFNSTIHSLETDSERIRASKKAIDRG